MTNLINTLRSEFAKIERIDPCSKSYENLISLLDRLDDSGLITVVEAKIKFVSALALNRCIRKGLV